MFQLRLYHEAFSMAILFDFTIVVLMTLSILSELSGPRKGLFLMESIPAWLFQSILSHIFPSAAVVQYC